MSENSIAIFERGAVLLAEADTIQKTKELKDMALTAAEWAKRKGMGEKAIQHCRSYALEAGRKMGEMLVASERAKGAANGTPGPGRGKNVVTPCNRVYNTPTLADLGISKRESSEAQILASLPPKTFDSVKSGEVSLKQILREKKEQQRENRRAQNRSKVAATTTPTKLDAQFSTIVIDPPWDWGDEGDHDQLGRARPDYATMSLSQLVALPIHRLSDIDCHLYIWITNRSLPKGFQLIDHWGFRYITALTWPKPHFGMGNYFRGQTEHVLFAVKGSQPLKRKDASTILPQWKRGPNGHSSKPPEFLQFVESCSPGPYLEMFSRSERKDWTAWGENS